MLMRPPPPPLRQQLKLIIKKTITINEVEIKSRAMGVKLRISRPVGRSAGVEKGGKRDAMDRLLITSRNIMEGDTIRIKLPTVVDMGLILQGEGGVMNLIAEDIMIRVDAAIRVVTMIITPEEEEEEVFTEKIVIDLGEVPEEREVHHAAPVDRAVIVPTVVTVAGRDLLVGAEVAHPVGAGVVHPMVPGDRGVRAGLVAEALAEAKTRKGVVGGAIQVL
jgi:hypothetical protein